MEQKHDRKTRAGDSAYQTQYNRRLRIEILNYYGGKCACCGESAREFLAIDHKNKDGTAMRKIHGQGGRALYGWIKRNGFPDIFRILCHNCNNAHGFYGYCPHDLTRTVRQQLDKILSDKEIDAKVN